MDKDDREGVGLPLVSFVSKPKWLTDPHALQFFDFYVLYVLVSLFTVTDGVM
jgi:hypothetical protein